jgi:hypothetical protein
MENFDLRKFLIENKLTSNSKQLDEIDVRKLGRNLAAGAAMTLGTLGAQGQTAAPAQTTAPTQTTQKSMFGTPEQRAAAANKRKENRKKIFDNFVKGAFNSRECVEVISDEEYADGCTNTDNDASPYINGTSTELPEAIYRELEDGTKIKIDLKHYQKVIKKRGKADDVALDGLQDPSFKPTQCGISKAHAKEDKKDWDKK